MVVIDSFVFNKSGDTPFLGGTWLRLCRAMDNAQQTALKVKGVKRVWEENGKRYVRCRTLEGLWCEL